MSCTEPGVPFSQAGTQARFSLLKGPERGLTSLHHYAIIRLQFRTRQAKVAQLVEHSTENAGVVGSIPSLGIFYA
jgi:hypothetical protein